jgi:predicted nucleotidyltransferase
MVATRAKDFRGNEHDVRSIEPLLARIVDEFRAIQIRLFGSRARGDADPTSDWDLFVIVPDDLAAADDMFAGYRLRRETRTRVDVILCPFSEFKEDRDTPNTLAYEAAHHGVAIYER